MTDHRDLMAALGNTTVAEILGAYESLLDEREELLSVALSAAWGSQEATATRQALYDVHRRLWLYAQMLAEAGRLIAATSGEEQVNG